MEKIKFSSLGMYIFLIHDFCWVCHTMATQNALVSDNNLFVIREGFFVGLHILKHVLFAV
jgi:hypothetical protein